MSWFLIHQWVVLAMLCMVMGCVSDDRLEESEDLSSPVSMEDASPDISRVSDMRDISDISDISDMRDMFDMFDISDMEQDFDMEVLPIDIEGRIPTNVPEGYRWIDLGEVSLLEGYSEKMEVTVADNEIAMWVVAVGPDDVFLALVEAIAPDGTVAVSTASGKSNVAIDEFAGGFGDALTSPNRVVGRPRASAAMIPNTPEVDLIPGDWTFQIGARDFSNMSSTAYDGPVHVGVLLRREEPSVSGALDVEIWVHESSGLNSASAATHDGLDLALQTIDASFSNANIQVGEVTYHDLDTYLPIPLDLGGPSCLTGHVPLVFDALPPTSNNLRIILIDSFTCLRFGGTLDSGASIAGVSNGVPVIPFAGRDGVLIGMSLQKDYPEDWAYVFAHEVGHALGLTHTAEPVRNIYDNIADTMEGDGAKSNLMYFNVSTATDRIVTSDQASVMHMHPLIRAR